ncbi:class I SAM-dependent methyltransferase [Cellulomonas hominis]|uniref:class I SAM-dependent methyltransferase n=1 Tax=Cellulomonas hominis TaxID=156981 RepID=UPI001B8FE7FC|nr:class I SAM-dependent methyltransferase [Cellulomonas hominis]VTR78626.1 hypothetical protein CHMI_03409 [Cellulomonas hominis]
MNRDLDAALQDLARGAAAQHRARDDDGLLTTTVRRVRRRRAVRGAAATTVGLALVVGGALAGSTLTGPPEPQPAGPAPTPTTTAPSATPEPVPTPTPTGPPPVVLPTGDPSLPFGACGSLVTAAAAHPSSPTVVPYAEPATQTAPAGGSLAVRGWFDRTPGPGMAAIPASGPHLAVVADGVVVAEGLLGGDPTWDLRAGFQGEVRTTVDWLSLAVCDPDGQPEVSAGAPLPAGEYQLVPWADVAELGDSEDALRTPDGEWPTVEDMVATVGAPASAVGAATPFTVTGAATRVVPPPGSTGTPTPVPTAAAAPECGGPAPVPDPANPLVLRWAQAGARLTPADLVEMEAPLRSTSAGRLGFFIAQPWVAAVRDGRVVGVSELSWEGDGRLLLATDTSVTLTPSVTALHDCADPLRNLPLPTGSYDVILLVHVWPEEREADADGGFTPGVVVSEPATLVVP